MNLFLFLRFNFLLCEMGKGDGRKAGPGGLSDTDNLEHCGRLEFSSYLYPVEGEYGGGSNDS